MGGGFVQVLLDRDLVVSGEKAGLHQREVDLEEAAPRSAGSLLLGGEDAGRFAAVAVLLLDDTRRPVAEGGIVRLGPAARLEDGLVLLQEDGGELVVKPLLESPRVETLAVDEDDAAAVCEVGAAVADVVESQGPDHRDTPEKLLPDLLRIFREGGFENAEGGETELWIERLDRGGDGGFRPAFGEEAPVPGKAHERVRRGIAGEERHNRKQ